MNLSTTPARTFAALLPSRQSSYEKNTLPQKLWQTLEGHEPLHHAELMQMRAETHDHTQVPSDAQQFLADQGADFLQTPEHVAEIAQQIQILKYDSYGGEAYNYSEALDPEVLVNFLLNPDSFKNLHNALQTNLHSLSGAERQNTLAQMKVNLEKLHTLVTLNHHHALKVHPETKYADIHTRHAEVQMALRDIKSWLHAEMDKIAIQEILENTSVVAANDENYATAQIIGAGRFAASVE